VKNGRLVLDEPTDLPEGEEVYLVRVDDGLSDEEREELHRSIEASLDDFEAGRVFDHEEVMAELLGNRS
jgi:ATP-dependent DNA ligase